MGFKISKPIMNKKKPNQKKSSSSNKINKDEWISKQISLLQIEKDAEIEASKLQPNCTGQASREQTKRIELSHLIVCEKSTGSFGRPTIKLVSQPRTGQPSTLPFHTFSSGDIIGIHESRKSSAAGDQIASGVIIRISNTQLIVALDADTSELVDIIDDAILRIRKLANDVTYRRIKNSLERLGSYRGPAEHLVGVLFMEEPPYAPLPFVPATLIKDGHFQLFNKNLDTSQICAVEFCLRQKDVAIIHGPPGTGKTTSLVEVILQHIKLGNKVLAVAPSNLAVDNLLERLVAAGSKVARMGHPARATPKAQLRSLDALVQSSDEYLLLKDVRADVTSSVSQLGCTRDKRHRAKLRADIKSFRKELRDRETRLAKQILKNCDVTLATLTSSGDDGPLRHLEDSFFDVTVIDECSQGLEASCYMSIVKSPKVIVVGDHKQLPPTVLSKEASSQGLLVSLMERVAGAYGDTVTQMLKVQYRMNENIMSWSSATFYNSELVAHESVANHLLCQLPEVEANEDTETSLVLIDTCGCNFEEVTGEELSKGNEGEASVVMSHVKKLLRAGVKATDVAVITPYNLQVEFIRNLLHNDFPDVEIRSVDGFQGREKEAVVLSMVRSNSEGEVGFLSEERRMNVAVTRARRHLAVVCDTGTVCRHEFLENLIDHITAYGDVRSAMEYDADDAHSFPASIRKAIKKDEPKIKAKPKPQTAVDADNAKRCKKYKQKISSFLSSNATQMQFDADLNSFERSLVHELAEQFGLIHLSTGEGKERRIAVQKPSTQPTSTESPVLK